MLPLASASRNLFHECRQNVHPLIGGEGVSPHHGNGLWQMPDIGSVSSAGNHHIFEKQCVSV